MPWNTTVRICRNTGVTSNHKPFFQSEGSKISYFASRAVLSFSANSYQREYRGFFKATCTPEAIVGADYIMWQNSDFGSKWMFGSITGVEYISPQHCNVHYEIDYFITYMSEISWEQCFVEREHSVTDVVGDHIQPENFSLNDYKNTLIKTAEISEEDRVVMLTTTNSSGDDLSGGTYGETYFGTAVWWGNGTYISNLIDQFRASTPFFDIESSDNIVQVYTVPSKATPSDFGTISDGSSVQAQTSTVSGIPEPTDLDNYTPRNKKLLTFPYCMLYVTTNTGTDGVYAYEKFDSGYNFQVLYDISPNPTIIMYPLGYKGVYSNYEESVKLQGFPICSWTSNNGLGAWISKNTGNILGTVATAGIGAVTGWAGFAVGGGQIGNTISSAYDYTHSGVNAKGNTGGGDVFHAHGLNDFYIYKRTIYAEQARVIDDFFDVFGYATNRKKTPNYDNRPYWNYIKTINGVVTGPIPREAREQISTLLDSGLTLWHIDKGAEIGHYGLDNSV